jgi:putative transposase
MMKRRRFSKEQIVRILREAEAIDNVRGVCRQHNITEQTFYRWRNKLAGMEVSDVKRLHELERENAKLKRLVGELSLNQRMLGGGADKRVVNLAARRRAAVYLNRPMG